MIFASSNTSGSVWITEVKMGEMQKITAFCSPHKPARVTTTNKTSCRRTLPWARKVYDLLAKKLKIKARPVDTVLAASFGRPSVVSPKSKPISITVLIPPTSANRSNLPLLFAMTSLTMFLNEIRWALLCFAKNSGDIFANHSQAQQLYSTKEENHCHERRIACTSWHTKQWSDE